MSTEAYEKARIWLRQAKETLANVDYYVEGDGSGRPNSAEHAVAQLAIAVGRLARALDAICKPLPVGEPIPVLATPGVPVDLKLDADDVRRLLHDWAKRSGYVPKSVTFELSEARNAFDQPTGGAQFDGVKIHCGRVES